MLDTVCDSSRTLKQHFVDVLSVISLRRDTGLTHELMIRKFGQDQMKWNESGFRPPLCTYRLNWARITSWGWWDDWDDTVLQTQDSKFEPWRSEGEHATSRSRREAPHNTDFHTWMGKKHFGFFQTAETGNQTPNSGVKSSGAYHYPRAPALTRTRGDRLHHQGTQQRNHIYGSLYKPILIWCWPKVEDDGPTLNEHWFSVSCSLSMTDITDTKQGWASWDGSGQLIMACLISVDMIYEQATGLVAQCWSSVHFIGLSVKFPTCSFTSFTCIYLVATAHGSWKGSHGSDHLAMAHTKQSLGPWFMEEIICLMDAITQLMAHGSNYSVYGSNHSAQGSWKQSPGSWLMEAITRLMAQGNNSYAHGSRKQSLGAWLMVKIIWRMAHESNHLAHGSWKQSLGSWLMEELSLAHGSWKLSLGSWLMEAITWLMAHGISHLAHGSWKQSLGP